MKMSELLYNMGACARGRRLFRRLFPNDLDTAAPWSDTDVGRLAKRCSQSHNGFWLRNYLRWLGARLASSCDAEPQRANSRAYTAHLRSRKNASYRTAKIRGWCAHIRALLALLPKD